MIHPFMAVIARFQLRGMLHRDGRLTRSQINTGIDGVDSEAVTSAARVSGVTFPDFNAVPLPSPDSVLAGVPGTAVVGAIGDGHIWAAIVAFLKSPEGQAILKIIFMAILAMFGL